MLSLRSILSRLDELFSVDKMLRKLSMIGFFMVAVCGRLIAQVANDNIEPWAAPCSAPASMSA
jgi:hypothetical protein